MATESLDRVGIPDLADSLPAALPYGHRKRVALARALVAQPRLLLLDEPASGLSENELPELGELMSGLARDTSLVVIEHRMDLMMSVCDTIFVLDFGKPDNALLRSVYFGYLRHFVPRLGRVFSGDRETHGYILESLNHYAAQQGVAAKMAALDLTQIRVVNLLGGIMSINYAEKPR